MEQLKTHGKWTTTSGAHCKMFVLSNNGTILDSLQTAKPVLAAVAYIRHSVNRDTRPSTCCRSRQYHI